MGSPVWMPSRSTGRMWCSRLTLLRFVTVHINFTLTILSTLHSVWEFYKYKYRYGVETHMSFKTHQGLGKPQITSLVLNVVGIYFVIKLSMFSSHHPRQTLLTDSYDYYIIYNNMNTTIHYTSINVFPIYQLLCCT